MQSRAWLPDDPFPMTTDAAAAAAFPARFHDYRDLPGDAFYRASILFGFAVVLYLSWRFDIFHGVVSAARHHQWGRFIVSPAILWTGMGMLMLLLRTLLWFRYRTPPLATMESAPSLTVIIPAYNEGAMVARSIESVVAARYPRERASPRGEEGTPPDVSPTGLEARKLPAIAHRPPPRGGL